MKRADDTYELREEYDFSQMAGGVRGKYAVAYRRGTNLVRLDPDVAEAFTTDESVNEAFRAVLKVATAIPAGLQPASAAPTSRPASHRPLACRRNPPGSSSSNRRHAWWR